MKARYGLTPAQIPDFKGIKGDSSDNLPGVPGIGEKGASKLLKDYGTLENLLFHVDEQPEKIKNALIDTHGHARFNASGLRPLSAMFRCRTGWT